MRGTRFSVFLIFLEARCIVLEKNKFVRAYKKRIAIFVAMAIVIMQVASAQQRPSRPPKPQVPPTPPQNKQMPPKPKMPLHNERNPYTNFHIFYVDEIEREDGVIEIEFNMPFNPESVTSENIFIDNEPLPSHATMSFNRRGNKIHIREITEWQGQQIIIEIKNIRSINDLEMQQLPAFYLGYDDDFEWDELHKVRWVSPSGTDFQ